MSGVALIGVGAGLAITGDTNLPTTALPVTGAEAGSGDTLPGGVTGLPGTTLTVCLAGGAMTFPATKGGSAVGWDRALGLDAQSGVEIADHGGVI